MKTKVVEIKVNNLGELLAAIMGAGFGVEMETHKKHKEEGPTVRDAILSIAEKKGWSFQRAEGWLEGIHRLCPAAAFTIVLKELAVMLDHKYEDHIEDSEHIYVISTLDGKVYEVEKACIKNYRNFAAFRTLEDAKYAHRVLSKQIRGMFRGAKK